MTRREFRSLAPPDDVREAIDTLELDAGMESVPLRDAGDQILAERIDAPIDVPGFDRAAMDGYALKATDTFGAAEHDPVTLDIAGTVHAGTDPAVRVEAGTAVEVATGAVLPEGADAVVPVEETRESDSGDTVEIRTAVAPADHVMARGADIAAGDRTLGPGTRLGPRHLGLLAAIGTETVQVRAAPTVGIIATGGELVQPGDSLNSEAGQIYDVNSHSIAGAIEAAGGEATVYATTTDDESKIRETLERAANDCDLLLTSGSTSAGSTDLLYRLIEDEGEKLVHGVALKPGRPMLVGRIFDTPYVGLPGYPVSALTVFRTFVAPALREASGRPAPAESTVEADLATRVRYDGGRLRLIAVGLVENGDGSLVAYSPAKGSGATTTLGETDGVVRMHPQTALLDAGTTVEVERFDASDPLPTLLGVGEPDPMLSRLLDDLDTPRYLTFGPADATRWVDDGIPDIVLGTEADAAGVQSVATELVELARWERDWGVIRAPETDISIEGVEDLFQESVSLAHLATDLAPGRAFDERLDTVADRGPESIGGYHRRLPGIESAARQVARGRATAGVGLRATADRLDLPFVELGTQTMVLHAVPGRRKKPGMQRLERVLEESIQ